MSVSVAIVGAGPAGFYTAESLLDTGDDVRIDIIERLPTPYGLIRAGVAPDHQTTKKVIRRYEQTAIDERVHFFGNVEVGRDISLDELRERYDAVVLAIGSAADRPLGIPGETKRGVYGAALFVGWYNGHPDFATLNPDLRTRAAVVVGNGNVALDVARVLVKTADEMAESDLADHAADTIHPAGIHDVYMLGRRGPADAKFTNVELREMGRLVDTAPVVDAAQLPDAVDENVDGRERRVKERNLATLKEFAAMDPTSKPKRVHFRFYCSPVEILGNKRVEGIRVEHTEVRDGRAVGTGRFETIDCGVVVAAVGYRAEPINGLPVDARQGLIPSDDGRVGDGLYAVGWAKRGPVGVIGSNRPDGETCAQQIREDISDGVKPGRPALEALMRERRHQVVTFDHWRRIDEAETSRAVGPQPRRKFTTLAEMMSVLDVDRPPPAV